MYRIRLENTITHQIYEQEVVDANNGDKLYFRFGVNTADLADGEYLLTLYNAENNVLVEDILRIGDFNPDTLQYNKGENTYISMELDAVLSEKSVVINEINAKITTDSGVDGLTAVYVDAQPVYDMGVNDQKSRLEAIKITENGTYSREDGYNEIEVEVPDLNGSYDEGYSDGYNTGYGEGEQVSYQNGYNDGYNTAGSEIAETAQVLNITENGVYASQYSDPVLPKEITGYFDDGTPFFNYVELKDITFDIGIYNSENLEVEVWWKGDVSIKDSAIFGNENFTIRQDNSNYYVLNAKIGNSIVSFTNPKNYNWYHFKMSYADGFWVNGVKIGDFENNFIENTRFYINSYNGSTYYAINGYFGMIKIGGNTIIPTEEGFKNVNTGELLNIHQKKDYYKYNYYSKDIVFGEGNLIKTVTVDVLPKISVAENKIKFGWSKSMGQVPECFDFEGIEDVSYLFYNCSKLETVPLFNTSTITDFNNMFNGCGNLKDVPLFDMSSADNINNMFNSCGSLTTIPQFNTHKVKNFSRMFYSCSNLKSVPALDASSLERQSYGLFGTSNITTLTDFGGLINLKGSIDGSYGFEKIPNLTYDSCINILNGLYDFVGNGVTPTSSQGKLKVHSNFLSLVGDQISIGTNKGWTITT